MLPKRMFAITLALVIVAAACGGDGVHENADSGLSGSVVISGSSTVEPISAGVAAVFGGLNPNVSISVTGPGTGDGFQLFCAGETDISDASRPIKDAEIELCAENGIEFIELLVAIDGLSVVTSVNNPHISCLATTDLYALLGPESTGYDTWSEADALAGQVGGMFAPYPDVPLVITAPGEESGTYDAFVEMALEDIAEDRGQDAVTRPDYQASANDNVIIEGIAGTDTSLGWVGYAFYLENQDRVAALAIDDGNGCVAPDPNTIADGSYPLSRPLFIYVSKEKAESKPEVAAFVDYYLSDEGLSAVGDTGYVRLSDDSPTRRTWEQRDPGPQANA